MQNIIFVIRYSLFVIRYSLFVIRYSLFVNLLNLICKIKIKLAPGYRQKLAIPIKSIGEGLQRKEL
jgi:hypothetical protein